MNTKNKATYLTIACAILVFCLSITSGSLAQGESTSLYLPLIVKSFPIETGKIVFVSSRDDANEEIFTMKYDGSEVVRLTNNTSRDQSPDWSPDGSKIAFVSNRNGAFDIYVMNADGTNQNQITTMGNCDSPQWSPDGNKIAFFTRQDNNNIIYTMNPDGGGLFQVTDPAISGCDPYWSPDGSRIAFLSGRMVPGVYAVNADGTNTALLFESTSLGYMAWSPDGDNIAFTKFSPTTYTSDVYVYNLNTSTITRITDTLYHHLSLDWSPDGYHFIFHSNIEDISNFEIYVMDAAGGQITNISQNPGGDSGANWTR